MSSPSQDKLVPLAVNVRIKIAALWTAVLFVFAYVDILSFYRADVRADIESGVISGFAVDQVFLLATTIYVAIPSVMVIATLVLRPRASRIVNIALGVPFALTIVVGAVGQWGYYIFGSLLEVAFLAGIVYYAWTWPRSAELTSAARRDPAAREVATA